MPLARLMHFRGKPVNDRPTPDGMSLSLAALVVRPIGQRAGPSDMAVLCYNARTGEPTGHGAERRELDRIAETSRRNA